MLRLEQRCWHSRPWELHLPRWKLHPQALSISQGASRLTLGVKLCAWVLPWRRGLDARAPVCPQASPPLSLHSVRLRTQQPPP